LAGAQEVEVNGKRVSAERILIATGSWPYIPEFPGSEHVIDSNQVFYLRDLPKKALVVGGGYIAVEFAGIFNGLGVETDLCYRGPLFLRGFDDEVREFVKTEVGKKGVNLIFSTEVTEVVKKVNGALGTTFNDGSTTDYDLVLYATGRRPKTANLGLEGLGVELTRTRGVKVTDSFQTNIPSIFAVGDVIDGIQLTPVALAEGTALANMLFNNKSQAVNYENVPSAVFCQPNIASVGLTEQQARQRFTSLRVFRSSFRSLKDTLGGSNEKTFMKLIVDGESDRLLAAHMVGSGAGEIIQGIAVAMNCGVTKAQLDSTIGIHPTAAEEFVTMRESS